MSAPPSPRSSGVLGWLSRDTSEPAGDALALAAADADAAAAAPGMAVPTTSVDGALDSSGASRDSSLMLRSTGMAVPTSTSAGAPVAVASAGSAWLLHLYWHVAGMIGARPAARRPPPGGP